MSFREESDLDIFRVCVWTVSSGARAVQRLVNKK